LPVVGMLLGGRVPTRYWTRQGETFDQVRSVWRAQSVVLSRWHAPVHEFGILNSSVIDGGMNAKVWLRTLMSAIVCSILGM
jgi:hypothetical protein